MGPKKWLAVIVGLVVAAPVTLLCGYFFAWSSWGKPYSGGSPLVSVATVGVGLLVFGVVIFAVLKILQSSSPLEEINEASEEQRYALGTRLEMGRTVYRYAQAGGDLKRGLPAFVHYEGEPPKDAEGHFIIGQEVADGIWGDIRPEGEKRDLVGWPTEDVARGLFFWLREIRMAGNPYR